MIKYSFQRMLGALVVVAVAGFCSVALAHDEYGHHEGHCKGPMDGMGMMGGHHMDDMRMMGRHHMGHHMGQREEWSHDSMGMDSGFMTARLGQIWKLDLTEEEKKKIRTIQRNLRATVWQNRDAIEDISDELFSLYAAKVRDPKAIGKVYGKIFDHKRQIIEAQIEAGNQAESVLTDKQRSTLKHWGAKHKKDSSWDD